MSSLSEKLLVIAHIASLTLITKAKYPFSTSSHPVLQSNRKEVYNLFITMKVMLHLHYTIFTSVSLSLLFSLIYPKVARPQVSNHYVHKSITIFHSRRPLHCNHIFLLYTSSMIFLYPTYILSLNSKNYKISSIPLLQNKSF